MKGAKHVVRKKGLLLLVIVQWEIGRPPWETPCWWKCWDDERFGTSSHVEDGYARSEGWAQDEAEV